SAERDGEEVLRALVAEARKYSMGVIADLVPNHMAIGGHDNRAWLDLLEWGMQSHYANFFDVDWEVPDPMLRQRVHPPFLGKPYGEALEDGDLSLQFDPREIRFFIGYYDQHFPINPRNYSEILDRGGEPLANWAALFRAASASKGRRENRVEEAREECRKALQEQPSLLGDVERALQE